MFPDGEMFHNISYVDDTGTAMGSRAGSHLGGSAIYSYDPRVSGNSHPPLTRSTYTRASSRFHEALRLTKAGLSD